MTSKTAHIFEHYAHPEAEHVVTPVRRRSSVLSIGFSDIDNIEILRLARVVKRVASG
jgi:hypothetical protein